MPWGTPHDAEDGLESNPERPGLSLKARALALLARREHARVELARKLAPHAESPEALEALLDSLVHEQWLSDARYAQSVVHRQAPRLGTQRIVRALRDQGVDADTITELREELRDSEAERARAVWQKKFGAPPTDARDYARQLRFITYRGFSADVLRRVIAAAQGND